MIQDVVNKLAEAKAIMSVNDTKWIQVENISGVDIAVVCQAYIRSEELEKGLQALQISSTAINSIQTTTSMQDGIYLFLLKNGKIVAEKNVEVNHPLHFGGYYFYQHSYDAKAAQYSVLMVVSDAGLSVVYLGYLMLSAGVFWKFWLKHLFRKTRN